MTLHIKNMVCPRCILAVRNIFEAAGMQPKNVELGEVEIDGTLNSEQKKSIVKQLEAIGFELLDDPRSQLVEKIRIAVIAWVRMEGERPLMSEYLNKTLSKDYSSISKLYSEVKGITIERFAILHRIEYAKELLRYSQLSTSQIAYKLGYNSPAHLSAQFKQITGMSPRKFKEQSNNNRIPLSEL